MGGYLTQVGRLPNAVAAAWLVDFPLGSALSIFPLDALPRQETVRSTRRWLAD